MRNFRVFGKTGRPDLPPHGTTARYWLEITAYQGESCAACKRAKADYQRKRKHAGKCARGLGWPLAYQLPGEIASLRAGSASAT